MSAADGRVLGLTPIKASGPPEARWNLVIVADGYTQAQMAQFAQDAQSISDHLFQTPPFDSNPVQNAMNGYRLDVASRQAGADKPRCKDGGGDGTSVATFFDSTFCYDTAIERLLYGNATLAMATVRSALPQWHQIIVLVNDRDRGGAGGRVAWLSNGGSDWRDVAIHELGHSAFGLADEYEANGPTQAPGVEPREVNVTVEPDPTRVKWHALVDVAPGVPTHGNPDCGLVHRPAIPFGPGTIGTFEGAKYMRCGFFRPAHKCKMKTTTEPFCGVCSSQIVKVMRPFSGQ